MSRSKKLLIIIAIIIRGRILCLILRFLWIASLGLVIILHNDSFSRRCALCLLKHLLLLLIFQLQVLEVL